MKNKAQQEVYDRARSFGYAFEGWWYVIKTQHNAWIHALASILVVVFGIWLRVSLRDWAVLILAITAVWVGEIMNTAVEAVVDLTMPDKHPLAKVAKDAAAAAVLVGAIGAAIVGFLILGPPLWEKLTINN